MAGLRESLRGGRGGIGKGRRFGDGRVPASFWIWRERERNFACYEDVGLDVWLSSLHLFFTWRVRAMNLDLGEIGWLFAFGLVSLLFVYNAFA